MTSPSPRPIFERRKPRPEELSRSARLDALLRLAQVGSWEITPSGSLSLSAESLRLLRLPNDQAPRSAQELIELSPPEERDGLLADFERSERLGSRLETLQKIVFEDGEPLYLAHRAEWLADELGARRLCGAMTDVTQTRQMSQRLSLTETLLEIAGRVARLGGWSADLANGMVHWSDEVCDIHQVPRGSLLSAEEAIAFHHPDSREAVWVAFERCATLGEPFDLECRVIGALGAERIGRVLGRAVRSESGEITRVEGAFHDITDQRLAETEALALSARLSHTLETMQDAFITLDPQGRLTYLNRQTELILGVSRSEALGRPALELFPDAAGTLFERSFEKAMAERRATLAEDYLPSIGRWLETRAHPTPDGLAVYFHDVTERRQEREQLTLLKSAMDRVNDLLLIVKTPDERHPEGEVIFANQAHERLLGLPPGMIIGKSPQALVDEHSAPQLNRLVSEASSGRGSRSEILIPAPDGSALWLETELSPIANAQGAVTHWAAIQRDITERKRAQEEIQNLAFADQLTGLPNRALLMERLRHAIAESERSETSAALLFIDLDNFKSLNDTLGHDKGDLLLRQAGARLLALAPEPDLAARVGGDEFVALLENLPRDPLRAAARVKDAAEAMLASLSEPYDLAGSPRIITASIGAALFGDLSASMGELLQRADLAMYQAKSAGGDCLRFFDPQMQAAMARRDALESELREGLRLGEFDLLYQPQVGADGRLTGAEALIRWERGERLASSPSDFIPLAEETGLIIPLGRWALEQACARLALWARSPETSALTLSVNVSALQFHQPDFAHIALECCAAAGADPRLLKLELTESVLVEDMEAAIEKMSFLLARGVRFSLDDFGTGYSSLSYLRRLPLTQVKIDQSFVRDSLTRPADAAIARSIISLCQSLGLESLAEGVETEDQRAFLLASGCELYQGYLFGAPMSAEAFELAAKASPP